MPLGKGIGYHIFVAPFVLGREGESLQKLNPFSMSNIELWLAMEEL